MAMNDFNIGFIGGLDGTKSKAKLNQDIDAIKKTLKELELKAKLDPNQVKSLETQLNTLKVNLTDAKFSQSALDGMVSQINNALKGIKIPSVNIGGNTNIGQQIGNNIAQGVASGVSKAKSELKSFSDLTNFSELNKKIEHLQIDPSALKNYNAILDEVKAKYAEFGQVKITNEQFNNGVLEKFKVNIEQVNGDLKETKSFMMALNDDKDTFIFDGVIKGSESVVQHLDKTKNAVNQTADAINALKDKAKVDKIQLSFDDGTYEAKYDSLIAKTRQWINANDESVISTQRLTTAYNEFNQAATAYAKDGSVANRDKLIQKEEELARQIKATTNEVKSYNAEYVKSSKVDSLHQKIQEFYDKNTATHRKWGAQLKNMLNETAHGAQLTATRVNEIEQEFLGVGNAARQAGKLGDSFFGSIKEQASKFVQWFSVTSVIMEGVQTLRKMKDAVYDIDTAMTNLYKVTDETDTKYNKFLNSACDNAQRLGRSVSSLIEQTANWAKLGYDIDEASKLAETSSIYANVGEVDDATAVSDIVTAIKSFNIEAGNSIEVVDKLNNLGNKYATSSADLGEGLSKSASALALAGNDINKTLAMLTGGTEITQNASEMGNALKVLSMRIRGMKGELEELGEEYENVESISKIQTQILNQTKGAVNIFDDAGNFRATYDILKDIAEVWDKISQVDQAALLETIAGKQRGNQIAALIQSFQSGQAQKAYADAINSSGSAMQEQERWMQSLEAKTQQFEAAFQSLSNTVLDSDLLKFFVDLGTTGVKAIDGLVNTLTPLGAASLIGGGILGGKNLGKTYEYTVFKLNCFEYALYA